MKKINKIILLTIFICLTYNNLDEGSQIEFERVTIKSNLVDVKSASKILKSTLKPIINVVETSYEKLHSATWYNSHGHKTASGQTFHKDSLTAAYNSAEFGTLLKVTNVENEKSIVVKVTDRMGNRSSNRIDLSLCAFDSIASPKQGRLKVKVEEIKKPL